MDQMKDRFRNLRRCAEDAPEGTYETAKQVHELIGDTCDRVIREIMELGLKADKLDVAFALETALYQYVLDSNKEATLFASAEGFGAAMDGPNRDRILATTKQNRDVLQQIRSM
ncbi:hypothetical protein ACFOY8_14255 [Thalassospira xianhensis]|uniref:Uncharacterized protein n=1 Tax=Thalassospira xianhensis MCCC 1A02616 TaxID=1177929 RepID=A0A367UK27_9PROT|nr:hypothetical protein [Thalassospira xianhensis]RCK07684.1 hypothetical protein TH5_01010 [Thalassospira xianhensis MCCC 1A02616]